MFGKMKKWAMMYLVLMLIGYVLLIGVGLFFLAVVYFVLGGAEAHRIATHVFLNPTFLKGMVIFISVVSLGAVFKTDHSKDGWKPYSVMDGKYGLNPKYW